MTNNSEFDHEALAAQLARLKQINELLQKGFQIFVHEFRMPLTYVIAYAQLLLEDQQAGPLTETQKEYIEKIQRKAQDMGKPLSEMFNVMSAVVVDQPKETDLASLINEHYSEYVDYKIPESVPKVWIDEYWLTRALDILFSSPAFVPLQEQKILLEIEKNEQYVIIHIKRKSEQELYCRHGEIGFESCQIGIEQQGGYLNWEQPTENELEFKLGLPIFDEKNSL